MSNPKEYLEKKTDNNSVETQMNHESLAILASLGSTKEYLGEEL